MKFALFCHSIVSDWNHGNAHFLRGVVRELQALGHDVTVFEPRNGWSRWDLCADAGPNAQFEFERVFPTLQVRTFMADRLDVAAALRDADVVLVHEGTDPELVRRISHCRRDRRAQVRLFHDSHHRALTDPHAMTRYDLSGFDGVLAFGSLLAQLYERRAWSTRAFVWHEAADVRLFRPMPEIAPQADLVWVGNWGDDDRTAELREFLLEPVRRLQLDASVYGVRYPEPALAELAEAGIRYGGFLPNHRVPEQLARHRVTVHIPRRPYAAALPGIPTIRVFEALACGIPLVCAPWRDCERLFSPGHDFLVVRDGDEMQDTLRLLLGDPARARELAAHGLATVRARHTCAHRAQELLGIVAQVREQRRVLPLVLGEAQ